MALASAVLVSILLLQAAPPPAIDWLEEAYLQTKEMPARDRIYALQRLAAIAVKAAPQRSVPWLREAFQAVAGAEPDLERRGRLRYQMVRDLAETNPSLALDLALEMTDNAAGPTAPINFQTGAVTLALLSWAKKDPDAASKGLERVFAAGLTDLDPADHLLSALRKKRPDLAEKIFERAVGIYTGATKRDVGMLMGMILECQLMMEARRGLALKTLLTVLDDIESLSKSGSEEAGAAIGPRLLALDVLRRVDPDQATRLAQKDAEAAAMLKDLPVGFAEMPDEAPQDLAPGVDKPQTENAGELPVESPEEFRTAMEAIRGLGNRDEKWTAARVAELATAATSVISRSRLRAALALTAIVEDKVGDKASSALRDALASIGELYDAEPALMSAHHRPSTNFYTQVITALAAGSPEKALNAAKDLPRADVRFEVMAQAAQSLAAARSR